MAILNIQPRFAAATVEYNRVQIQEDLGPRALNDMESALGKRNPRWRWLLGPKAGDILDRLPPEAMIRLYPTDHPPAPKDYAIINPKSRNSIISADILMGDRFLRKGLNEQLTKNPIARIACWEEIPAFLMRVAKELEKRVQSQQQRQEGKT